MKTTTLDVGGMLSMLDYRAVESQLGQLPGGAQRRRQHRIEQCYRLM